ncbi:hypothetical protein [Thioalkalivibrio sp. ALE19]|uniref:hypothetical protein n=1 Tax=Thioalkalivibrio sp. ALE19 TaxID=1266909 RepID=UPI0004190BFE|nr:hypothetical protein [Thioalkalivibrio sp. ALE19]
MMDPGMTHGSVPYRLTGPSEPVIEGWGRREYARAHGHVQKIREYLGRVGRGEVGLGAFGGPAPLAWEVLFQDPDHERDAHGLPKAIPAIFRQSDEVSVDDLVRELGNLVVCWRDAQRAEDSRVIPVRSNEIVVMAGDGVVEGAPKGEGYRALEQLSRHPLSRYLEIR